ncbi:copper chaperone PCu(A)C [Magnetofaba australis]|uniref:Copper chaperone PCu(A)C n=1 Tax=Magnetofaba australis IT-1 TaxID=1434232 RepID=A0A1Y2K0W1_9PROT|nr:copper chaperone PCu(A)C [Magnetofaba australis]OSM01683.1 hypothetical protein MAIT1_01701 [Magnetofaba australis IT-1]
MRIRPHTRHLAALIAAATLFGSNAWASDDEHMGHKEHAEHRGHMAMQAQDGQHKASVSVSAAWARASAKMARAGAAFMRIDNTGASDDKLISAAADVSDKVELHTHTMENGMMRMYEVPSIPVPAGTGAMLQPGGFHVMFIGLHAPLSEGQSFPLTLNFEKTGKQTVMVHVKAPGAMGHSHGHMSHHGH